MAPYNPDNSNDAEVKEGSTGEPPVMPPIGTGEPPVMPPTGP